MQRSTWQGREGGLWPIALEEPDPANNQASDHGQAPSPVPGEPSDEAAAPAGILILACEGP